MFNHLLNSFEVFPFFAIEELIYNIYFWLQILANKTKYSSQQCEKPVQEIYYFLEKTKNNLVLLVEFIVASDIVIELYIIIFMQCNN